MTHPMSQAPTDDAGGSPGELAAMGQASLLFLSGPDEGLFVRIAPDGARLGRHREAEIQVRDAGVSRQHARLVPEADRFRIEDAGSRFGTFVEGRRVESALLGDGARVQLSRRTVVKLRYHGAAEARLLDRWREAAIHDPLTGIPNRRFFMRRLDEEFRYAVRHGTPLALLMIDVDGLKRINDAHGHLAGDQCIFNVAHRLGDALRQEDVLARYGGDEFVLCARGLDAASAVPFAERLQEQIRHPGIVASGRAFHPSVSVSVGIGSCDVRMPETMTELIGRADSALYAAKRLGGDCVAAWRPGDLELQETTIGPCDSRLTQP